MTDIDWSKAPEGFPIWIEDLNPGKGFDCSGWHRDDGDRYTNENGKYWTKLKEGIYRVHSPAPQWNGEGLPPVGTACTHMDGIERFRVFAVDGAYAAIASEYTRFWCPVDDLHPIKTPAQIAADEREAAIDEMAGWAGATGLPIDRERKIMGRLYDARYRRMPAGEDQ